MRIAISLALLIGCTPATQPITPSHPAHPDAEPGRLAGPPATLRPGVEPTAAEPKPDPKAKLLAEEIAAYDKAKPVFDKWCAKCHQSGNKLATQNKLDHFDMTKYPFGGHHATEISKVIRKALAIGGGSPTMPFDKKGAVKGEELAAIAAWADAFDAAHASGAHEGGAHDHGGHKH